MRTPEALRLPVQITLPPRKLQRKMHSLPLAAAASCWTGAGATMTGTIVTMAITTGAAGKAAGVATTVTIATVCSDPQPLLQTYAVSLNLCHHTMFLELPGCVNWPTAPEDSPLLLCILPGFS